MGGNFRAIANAKYKATLCGKNEIMVELTSMSDSFMQFAYDVARNDSKSQTKRFLLRFPPKDHELSNYLLEGVSG